MYIADHLAAMSGDLNINVLQDASVDELFQLLEGRTGVPPDEARLLHAGKELVQKRGKLISDYPSIVHGSTLFMVMRLKGGEVVCLNKSYLWSLSELIILSEKHCIYHLIEVTWL